MKLRFLFIAAVSLIVITPIRQAKAGMEISANEAAKIALENNYDIKTAKIDEDIFKLSVDLSEALYDNILSFSTGYTINQNENTISQFFGTDVRSWDFRLGYQKKFSTGTGLSLALTSLRQKTDSTFVTVNPFYDTALEIGITQPLLNNFGGLQGRLGTDIAKAEVDILNFSVQERIEQTLYNVLSTYWNMYLAFKGLSINKQALSKAQKLVKIARGKLKRGLFEKVDVYAFEALESQRMSDVLKSEQAYEDLGNTLRHALGFDSENKEISPSQEPKITEVALDFDENAKEAMKSRRDYLTAKKKIEKSNLELRLYKNSRFPKLDLLASLKSNGLSGSYVDAWGDVPQVANPLWFFGVEMEWNINSRESKSNYARAKFEKAQSLIDMKRAESLIVEDLNVAIRAVNVARDNAKRTAKTKEFQEKKLKEEEKRFNQGRSRSDIVIGYENDVLFSQLAHIEALVEYELSVVRLLSVKNSLLSRFLM